LLTSGFLFILLGLVLEHAYNVVVVLEGEVFFKEANCFFVYFLVLIELECLNLLHEPTFLCSECIGVLSIFIELALT